jgi:hypothetical protein
MLHIALALCLFLERQDQTPSIYRCPAKEATTEWLNKLFDQDGFDEVCVDPSPSKAARETAAGFAKFVSPGTIDTRPNRAWRDNTIAYALGKISPKEWLRRTSGHAETVHFLSSPATETLVKVTGMSTLTSVFSEIFLVSLPGKPCLTADDIGRTRYLPDAGRLQSWILAMNDLLGPMLQYRHDQPYLVTGKPTILRADPTAGLLIFRQDGPNKRLTFYFNNSTATVKLPKVNLTQMTINRGVKDEGSEVGLMDHGFLIIEEPKS